MNGSRQEIYQLGQEGINFDVKIETKIGEEVVVKLPQGTRIEETNDVSGKKICLACSRIVDLELPKENRTLIFVPTGQKFQTHSRPYGWVGRFPYYDPEIEDSNKKIVINAIELY